MRMLRYMPSKLNVVLFLKSFCLTSLREAFSCVLDVKLLRSDDTETHNSCIPCQLVLTILLLVATKRSVPSLSLPWSVYVCFHGSGVSKNVGCLGS
ncbi:hypothetical protein BDV23DRAFT_52659 [Aspergillus alliaceus]|uniref:Uncharacterized protein n=1 Tax=Petromyces alliaceus TaxID=209559 RepID=A0A5N7CEQ7_PETAA|nr:hypothetical protein BDV23DRAFT_52659 [Aspergillus alliaceus]